MQSLRAITLRGFLGAVISVIIWASTHGFFWVFDRWFELALFPKVLLAFGVFMGTALMAVVSFLICWGLIALYDWYGKHDVSGVKNWITRKFLIELKDALGFETLKETAGEVRKKLFTPVEFVSPVVVLPRGFRWLTLPALVIMEVLALAQNIGLWVWEVLRLFFIAPIAGLMFRHRLEKAALFLYTSIWNDPMTCLILMRPARMYGMGKKEWKIFLSSVVLSNASWGTLITAGMYFVQKHLPWLWHWWLTLIHWLTPHLFT